LERGFLEMHANIFSHAVRGHKTAETEQMKQSNEQKEHHVLRSSKIGAMFKHNQIHAETVPQA
jgi:hypothetical protein